MGLGNNAAALPLPGARLTAGHFRTAVLEEDGEEEKRKRGEKNTTKKKILLTILKMENIALNRGVLFFLVYLHC